MALLDVARVAGSVELVQGPLGAGKTTYAARTARRLARDYGLKLVSNAELGPDWLTLDGWDDLEDHPHSVVLLDEVHMTLPSDSKLGNVALYRAATRALTMGRKRRQVFIGTVQRWTAVSPLYRELGTRFLTCHAWFPGRLHLAFEVEASELRKAKHNQSKFPVGLYDPRKSRIDTLAEVRPWWAV